MVPSFCRLELPQPSYRLIKTLQVFTKYVFYTKFYNGFVLKISTCTIMLGFCKSGHIYYPYSDCCLFNHYKTDAVRIGIVNVLELIFRLSHCSMITELKL